MSIVKICKVHGELTLDKTLISSCQSGKYTSLRCKECARTKQRIQKRGISNELYEKLQINQNKLCAICNKLETISGRSSDIMPLAIDHCHKCKKHFRELLCQSCNTGLGYSKDNIQLLQNAILYLQKHTHITDDSIGITQ